ncbi:MAG: MarR family winged helix-turn-helix transcriptional regulator [Acidimicrobiia bacterium]
MAARPNRPTTEPAVDDSALAPRLRLAVTRLHRRLRQSAEPGLTISQLSALASIERDGPVTLGDLARIEQVQPPTMTSLAGKLEAAGLVTRTIDPVDRRVHRVAVTPAGTRWLARHRSRKNAYLERRLRTLDPDDRAVLVRAAELLEELARDGGR